MGSFPDLAIGTLFRSILKNTLLVWNNIFRKGSKRKPCKMVAFFWLHETNFAFPLFRLKEDIQINAITGHAMKKLHKFELILRHNKSCFLLQFSQRCLP